MSAWPPAHAIERTRCHSKPVVHGVTSRQTSPSLDGLRFRSSPASFAIWETRCTVFKRTCISIAPPRIGSPAVLLESPAFPPPRWRSPRSGKLSPSLTLDLEPLAEPRFYNLAEMLRD